MKKFNYAAWLKNRAEKPATKVLPFAELTKAEKIAALLQLLGKSESVLILLLVEVSL
jgi:flagellar motor switch protein FliG